MRSRRAFTLVEVMVALTITGLVTSIAWAAMQGGIDTRERLDRQRTHGIALVAARDLVGNALRHALPGNRGGGDTFTVVAGSISDSLAFLTRGIQEPLGTSDAWRFSLWVAADTLHLAGAPVATNGPGITATVPGVHGVRVRALARGTFARWEEGWSTPDVAPAAVQLAWGIADGPTVNQVQRIGLERIP